MQQPTRPGGFNTGTLTRGQWILGISSVVLLIVLFLPWESLGVDLGGPFGNLNLGSTNAFGASGGLAWLSLLGILAVLVVEGLILARTLPPTVPGAMISAISGGVAALIALIAFLMSLGNITWGAFVGLIAAIAVGYGAWLRFQESRTMAPPPAAPPPAAPPPAP
jgi:hypothetical protein